MSILLANDWLPGAQELLICVRVSFQIRVFPFIVYNTQMRRKHKPSLSINTPIQYYRKKPKIFICVYMASCLCTQRMSYSVFPRHYFLPQHIDYLMTFDGTKILISFKDFEIITRVPTKVSPIQLQIVIVIPNNYFDGLDPEVCHYTITGPPANHRKTFCNFRHKARKYVCIHIRGHRAESPTAIFGSCSWNNVTDKTISTS